MVAPDIQKVMESDSKLRVVYKEFPILGPASTTASKAALASVAQGKYLPFHDQADQPIRASSTMRRSLPWPMTSGSMSPS